MEDGDVVKNNESVKKKKKVIPSSLETSGLSYSLWSKFLLLGKKKLKNIHLAGGIKTETYYLALLWRAIRRVHGTSISAVQLAIGFLNISTINIFW